VLPAVVLAAVTLHQLWAYRDTHWITSRPARSGALVYVGTWGGSVVALDAGSGRVRWKRELGANPDETYGETRGVISSIAVADGVAYAASGSCRAGAFDAQTGRTLWERTICSVARNDDTYASPVVARGIVLFGISVIDDRPTDRGYIVALDARTGDVRWRLFPQRYAGTGSGISATPLVDPDGIAYVGTGNPTPRGSPPPGPDPYSDSILAFDVESGALRWEFGPVHPHDTHDRDMFASPNRFVVGEGLQSRELIGEGGKDATYYAVDARNGHLVWETAVDPQDPFGTIIGTAATGNGRIFVPVYAMRGALVALSQRDGRVLWRQRVAGIYEAPLLAGGVVFAAAIDGTLYGFAAGTGQQLFELHIGGRFYGRGPSVFGTQLFVSSAQMLYAFELNVH
jgi:outer membrane protein assembly factor BamB